MQSEAAVHFTTFGVYDHHFGPHPAVVLSLNESLGFVLLGA
jgi:hypothetical protein